jgi:hypothetical protein
MDCGAALLDSGKENWALEGLPEAGILLEEIQQAMNKLAAKKPVPEELRETLASGSHRLPNESTSTELREIQQRWLKDLGAGICAGCVRHWLAGSSKYQVPQGAEWVPVYADAISRYHSFCTSRGATWMGGTPYGDDPVLWRVKDERGKVMRYIRAPEHGFERGWVYGVDEANGQVGVYSAGPRGTCRRSAPDRCGTSCRLPGRARRGTRAIGTVGGPKRRGIDRRRTRNSGS